MFDFIFDPLQKTTDKYGKIVPILILVAFAAIIIPVTLYLQSINVSPVIPAIILFIIYGFIITGGFGLYKKG
jgi:hypothetical protein